MSYRQRDTALHQLREASSHRDYPRFPPYNANYTWEQERIREEIENAERAARDAGMSDKEIRHRLA